MFPQMRLLRVLFWVLILGVPMVGATAQVRRQKPPPTPAPARMAEEKRAADEASASRANLVEKTKNYRQSLDQVLQLQKREQGRLTTLVATRTSLLEAGIIARREVDETETQLVVATQQISDTVKQIEEADSLVSEVLAAEQLAKIRPEPPGTFRSGVTLIRYSGTSFWTLDGYAAIDLFFRERFGRSMPVSAFGQSGAHDRLGFDHRGALDVAVHPDTAEGQTLMAYLRMQGIPFLAFRAAVAGSATGAHIHIGPPSHRASVQ